MRQLRRLALLAALAIAIAPAPARAQAPYTFHTIAGLPPGSPLSYASGIAVDAGGSIYVFDSSHFVIRKVTPAGLVSIVAGSPDSAGSTDGLGSNARFGLGYGLAVDPAGNLYVADTFSRIVRKITPAGEVTTLAGLAGQQGSTDGLGSAARFDLPHFIAADAGGNVFVAEPFAHTIRKITPTGLVTTLAGLAGAAGSADGQGSSARFNNPRGIAVGSGGNIYVADGSNHTIRRITPSGDVTTLAGTAGVAGGVDGIGAAARFSGLTPIGADAAGDLYVSDNCTIRKVTSAGAVTTVAGLAGACGSVDGLGPATRLTGVTGLAVSPAGTAYFLELGYVTALRRMTTDGAVTTILAASGPAGPGSADGTGAAARFTQPGGAAFHLGATWVADGMRVRRVTPAGAVTSEQLIDQTRGLAVDSTDRIYVTLGCGIGRLTPGAGATVISGVAPALLPEHCGAADGIETARFNRPVGLAVNGAGVVYVADTGNSTIRALTPRTMPGVELQPVTSTLAGLAGSPGSSNGTGNIARFSVPTGLVVDGSGNLYVADSGNHTIRRVTPAGVVTTFAGQAGTPGSEDGTGAGARFREPYGLTIDGSGNLFVTELGNSTVRRITPAGEVTTIGGLAPYLGHADGVGPAARFASPKGIAVDPAGTLYVVDTGNYSVRQGFLGLPVAPTITSQPANQSVAAGQYAQFVVAAAGTPSPGYRWQVSTNGGASWSDVADNAPYSGASTPTLTVGGASLGLTGHRFRSVVTNLGGSATSQAATLTVSSLILSAQLLRFGATKAGADGDLVVVTPRQTVSVTYSAPSAPIWTATADRPWLQISNASGAGAGHFAVGVINPANVIDSSTSLSGTVTVTAANVGLIATIPIFLSVQLTGTSESPIGVFDTPAANATIRGSIAVTGWALDDVGVDRVEIWRDRAPGETTVVYTGSGPGNGKIFVANALFVSGARPDVEAVYRSFSPQAYRAGWGYLMLTWGLWNQGNGPFTLYAFAYDGNANVTTLGTKTVTASNATATRPFGAIDTPGYGATVSGSVWNYGWALTPNVPGVPSPCVVQPNAALMTIDSRPGVIVNYGVLRDDIAAAFPGFSNGNTAGGSTLIDTTTLSDGMHTIGWLVSDSCGRMDGIGSRFFSVLNGATSDAGRAGRDVWPTRAWSEAVDVDPGPVAAELTWDPVEVRRNGASAAVYPGTTGVRVVPIGQDERVEVHLPTQDGVDYEGVQIVNGGRQALPIGSSLDAQAGIFYWQPAAGFLGSYHLRFEGTRTDGRRTVAPVRVVVGPPIRMAIDTPRSGDVVDRSFTVAGWALDLAADDGSGIDTVHVWAYPVAGGPPVFLGVPGVGGARPDVGATYGASFVPSAYDLVTTRLAPGDHDVVVYVHRAATNAFDAAQVVRVTVR